MKPRCILFLSVAAFLAAVSLALGCATPAPASLCGSAQPNLTGAGQPTGAQTPGPGVSGHPQQANAASALLPAILDPDRGPRERLRAAEGLGGSLTRAEINVLYEYLKSPAGQREADLPSLYALKNSILNALREQTAPPPDLVDTLIAIYRDPAQDAVIRDYAIQHLAACCEDGAGDRPASTKRILEVLSEAARENSSIGGTALLALHLLSASDAAVCREEIDQLAIRLTSDSQAQTAARITAVQICAERGLRQALPAIERLAQEAGCIPLRRSAQAALCRLGGSLQPLSLHNPRRFKNEVRQADFRSVLEPSERKPPIPDPA